MTESITELSALRERVRGWKHEGLRVALVRLVAAGLIETAGRGAYRLGPNASSLAADVAGWRQAEQHLRPWRGDWIAGFTWLRRDGDRLTLDGAHAGARFFVRGQDPLEIPAPADLSPLLAPTAA